MDNVVEEIEKNRRIADRRESRKYVVVLIISWWIWSNIWVRVIFLYLRNAEMSNYDIAKVVVVVAVARGWGGCPRNTCISVLIFYDVGINIVRRYAYTYTRSPRGTCEHAFPFLMTGVRKRIPAYPLRIRIPGIREGYVGDTRGYASVGVGWWVDPKSLKKKIRGSKRSPWIRSFGLWVLIGVVSSLMAGRRHRIVQWEMCICVYYNIIYYLMESKSKD